MNETHDGLVIPGKFIEAQWRHSRGKSKTQQMVSEINQWLWFKDKGASSDIMNRLLEQVLLAFRKRDSKYFRLIAEALEYSKKGDDPEFYIFRAVKSLCTEVNPTYSTKITADPLIEKAKSIWADELSRRLCPKPKNPKEKQESLNRAIEMIEEKNIRWPRVLDECGLGSGDGVKPRKSGRKKGTRNAHPTKEGRR